jgi:DNA-binding transcriptional ArsR family regulator
MDGEDLLDAEPVQTLEIQGIEPLKMLSDPLRMRLVEVLRRHPATVKELAAVVELAPRSLYYHINLLERHGLIRVVRTRVVSGIIEKTYRATAYVFAFAQLSASGGAAMAETVGAQFHSTQQEFAASLQAGRLPGDPGYQLEWDLLTLSSADADAFVHRFAALLEEFQARSAAAEADQPVDTYRLLFTFFRTYFRGARREPQPEKGSGDAQP